MHLSNALFAFEARRQLPSKSIHYKMCSHYIDVQSLQEEYLHRYFLLESTDHLIHKVKRGQKTAIAKRYFYHTKKLRRHPEFLNRASPSLDARMEILATAVPELASVAAAKAIAEWGRPASEVTHLIDQLLGRAHARRRLPPGGITLLGLRTTVQRTMLYMYGCTSTSAALRAAKDITEKNSGACADLTLMLFHAPDETRNETLVMQSINQCSATAPAPVGGGAEPVSGEAWPKFELVSASQAMVVRGRGLDVEAMVLRATGELVRRLFSNNMCAS